MRKRVRQTQIETEIDWYKDSDRHRDGDRETENDDKERLQRQGDRYIRDRD